MIFLLYFFNRIYDNEAVVAVYNDEVVIFYEAAHIADADNCRYLKRPRNDGRMGCPSPDIGREPGYAVEIQLDRIGR